MAFALNEEQSLLQEQAKKFFQEEMPVAHLRHLRDTEDAIGFDPKLWRQMGELGLTGTLIAEDFGGTDFGALGLCVICEEAGRTLAPSPLFSTSLLAAAIISAAGSAAQKRELLPKIAQAEIVIALAVDEDAHHAPDNLGARAEKSDGGYVLNGRKIFVIDGQAADKIIFASHIDGGRALFLLDAAEVERIPMALTDSRNYATVIADNIKLNPEQMIGTAEQGSAALDLALDLGRIAMASEMLGGAREVFERTLAHIKERKQFGQVLGAFQALKHRMAKLYCEIELSHSAVRAAAEAYENRANNIPLMASLAKARLCDCAKLASNEAVQLHGGMGMTDEVDIGLFLKRARVQAQIFGDAHFHRARFASLEAF